MPHNTVQAQALILAKLQDGLHIAQRRPWFLGFLPEEHCAVCQQYLKKHLPDRFLFWGGFDRAQRTMCGLFPDYLTPDNLLFPLSSLTFTYREEDVLTHRDILGVVMALGVERAVVGDILSEPGRSVLFCREEMTSYFLSNLRKVGKTGVRIEEGATHPLPISFHFETYTGVVASQRLDCVVAFLCRISREKAAQLITGAFVEVNHQELSAVAHQLQPGDTVSIRKKGKFILDGLGPLTSKGRLTITCRKYI